MDPIKVEFSDKGKRKKVKDVLIPPEKAGLKIVINIIVTLIVAAVIYYFMLPPMNPQAYEFYMYWAIVAAVYVGCAFLTSSAFAKPEYVPYAKKQSIVPVAIVLIIGVVAGIGYLVSAPLFRAKAYASILEIPPQDFVDTFSNIDDISDFEKIPLIDKDAANVLADKQLGDFAKEGLVSQFEILEADSTQINYNGAPYRVYPLQYGDIFKWFKNSVASRTGDGIPGYVRVNLNTQEAELVQDYNIKYSTAEHFNEYLIRHLRFEYPTSIFGEISFEINDEGKPFWVVEDIVKTVGLFGGEDVKGIFLVDAESGDPVYYAADEYAKDGEQKISDVTWIDQAYDADLLVQQYNYNGKYAGGFFNSIFGQEGVKQASQGYSFLVKDDDVYLYTGVTSVNADESIIGFFFINQRTKEGFFYETTGTTEVKAQESAQGEVQHMGYTASFPILLNVDGVATYFMSLKDSGNYVKSYAFVNVNQVSLVAAGETNEDYANALEEYIVDYNKTVTNSEDKISIDFGKGDKPSTDDPVKTPDDNSVEIKGIISNIRTTVVDGNTYFYVELDSKGVYYYIAADVDDKIVLFNEGDEIIVTVNEESEEKLVAAISMIYAADKADEPAVEENVPEEGEDTPAEGEDTPAEDEASDADTDTEAESTTQGEAEAA